MRHAEGIFVDYAIVHRLPGKGHKKAILSEEPLELVLPEARQEAEPAEQTPSQRVNEYLERQVQSAVQDGAAVAANFTKPRSNRVRQLVHQIIDDPAKLVGSSQELASFLATAIGSDQRIKPGHLAICRFRADNLTGQHFVALIKIDLIEVLTEEISHRKGGHHTVRLRVRDDALATLNQKLQKAAVIRKSKKDGYEVLLLDRQVTATAAEFFREKFLGVVDALDARELTKRVWTAAFEAHDELTHKPTDDERAAGRDEALLTLEQADDLRQSLPGLLDTEKVDVDAWVAGLRIPKPARAVVAKIIEEKDVPHQFEIDKDFAKQKLIKKMKFVGEDGVRVEFDASAERNVIVSKQTKTRPDGERVTTLTMMVRNLEWIKR